MKKIVLPLPALGRHAGGQPAQLLHGQQAGGPPHENGAARMQAAAAIRRQFAVPLRVIPSGEVEAGLFDRTRKHVAQNLQIEGQVAVAPGIGVTQQVTSVIKLASHLLEAVQRGVARALGKIRADGSGAQTAPPMAATSAAKSADSTSIPSPRLKRTKRRTWMFSPTLPATCLTISETVMAVSLM